jgi:iron complex transport system ATP-binding protein
MTLMRELQRMGKTVVTVLHDLNQASRYCDHLVVLEGVRCGLRFWRKRY